MPGRFPAAWPTLGQHREYLTACNELELEPPLSTLDRDPRAALGRAAGRLDKAGAELEINCHTAPSESRQSV